MVWNNSGLKGYERHFSTTTGSMVYWGNEYILLRDSSDEEEERERDPVGCPPIVDLPPDIVVVNP